MRSNGSSNGSRDEKKRDVRVYEKHKATAAAQQTQLATRIPAAHPIQPKTPLRDAFDFEMLNTHKSGDKKELNLENLSFAQGLALLIPALNKALNELKMEESFNLLLKLGIFLQKKFPNLTRDNINEILEENRNAPDPAVPFFNKTQKPEQIPDLTVLFLIDKGYQTYVEKVENAVGMVVGETVLTSMRLGIIAHKKLLNDERDTYGESYTLIMNNFEAQNNEPSTELDKYELARLMPLPPQLIQTVAYYADNSQTLLQNACELFKNIMNKYIGDFLKAVNLRHYAVEIAHLQQKFIKALNPINENRYAEFIKDVIRLTLAIFFDGNGQLKEQLVPVITDYIESKTFISQRVAKHPLKQVCEQFENITTITMYLSRLVLKLVTDIRPKEEVAITYLQNAIMDAGDLKNIIGELRKERIAVKKFLQDYMDRIEDEGVREKALVDLSRACKDINSRLNLQNSDYNQLLIIDWDLDVNKVLGRVLPYIGSIYPQLLKNIFDQVTSDLAETFKNLITNNDGRILTDSKYQKKFENKFLKICDLLMRAKQLHLIDAYAKKLLGKAPGAELNKHDFVSLFRSIVLVCGKHAKETRAAILVHKRRNADAQFLSPKAAAVLGLTEPGSSDEQPRASFKPLKS